MRASEFIFEKVAEGKMKPTRVTGTEKPGSVKELEKALLKAKDRGIKLNYDKIDKIMQLICKEHNLTGDKLHNDFVKKHHTIPDNWIKKQSVTENFADGKGPGRPGDSQRHGIPKKATMAQLQKAAKAKGRKGQLARWQINMRRGKKKHAKESIQETANNLSSIVNQDQVERNEYKKFVMSQANGDWENGAKMYAQLKKRPPDDIFGDKIRLSQFMKMQFAFNKFTEDDWNNYWVLVQHCDFNPAFQKKALDVIKQYQGENHSNYKYLYDRISCSTSGTQKYGTQDICSKRG